MLNLKEIAELTEEHIETEVCCELLVDKLDRVKKWYVIKCTSCLGVVDFAEDKFKCNKCSRLIPHPRRSFCLEALCSDQAGSVTIVLPHSSVVRIAQKNVEDLYSLEKVVKYWNCLYSHIVIHFFIRSDVTVDVKLMMKELGEHFFPPFLQLFERKKYVITILISEQNIRDGSTVYEATEIGDVVESSGQFTPSGQETVDQHVYSPMNVLNIKIMQSAIF
ncbi:uncharacterized protein LOC141716815 isoform X2 [Apium graveolens]|uniref:uncharacterized protein LOC141716815 isoform X2 n=1 Tax=Apium graveolens TaxID=4045 RepID=UPI003D7BB8C4